jgi:hypothetical protein
MRTQTFISSMVGVAAALAGSANADYVPWTFDTFTVAQSSSNPNNDQIPWEDPSSAQPIFGASGTRLAYVPVGNGDVSVGNGTATLAFGNSSVAALFYSNDYVHNLTGYIFSFDWSMANPVGSWAFEMWFETNGNYNAYQIAYTGDHTYTVDLSTLPTYIYGEGFDITATQNIYLHFESGSDGSGVATISNFGYVPAPGAAALIGLAGLVATRRRRN